MEDFTIDIMIDKGPSARSIKLNLNSFTLVGATTKLGNLTSPMRDRFGVILRMNFYSIDELIKIITRSANILDIRIDKNSCWGLVRASNTSPNLVLRFEGNSPQDLDDIKNVFKKAISKVDNTIKANF